MQAELADGMAPGMGLEPEQDLPRPPAPPELEDVARRALAWMRAELARPRQHGIPAEHTWSAVLAPIVWLSLPVYGHRLLLPAMVLEGVGIRPLRKLIACWQRQGVQLPGELVAWLHGREGLGLSGEALAAFGYLPARPQAQILAQARVDQQLHLSLQRAASPSMFLFGPPYLAHSSHRDCLLPTPVPHSTLCVAMV